MTRQIAALAACCLMSFACLANDLRFYGEDQVPTPADIAALLAAPAQAVDAPSGLGGRTRAARLLDTQTTPHRVATPAPQPAPGPVANDAAPLQVARLSSVGSVALALRFGTDATQVHAQHLAKLDALAQGIQQLPEQAIITIAGHTDAFGSAAYNIDLSLKRALAVRAYLVQVHGIAGRRLVALGKGKSEPLNRANPYAPENRRVQVHAEYETTQSGAVLLSDATGTHAGATCPRAAAPRVPHGRPCELS